MSDDAIRIIENSFVELTIQDAIWKSKQMPVPSNSLMNQFGILIKMVMGHLNGTFQSQRRDVISFFGAPTIVIAKLWDLIVAKTKKKKKTKTDTETEDYRSKMPNICCGRYII